jgi:hypothetical protein
MNPYFLISVANLIADQFLNFAEYVPESNVHQSAIQISQDSYSIIGSGRYCGHTVISSLEYVVPIMDQIAGNAC